MEIKPIGVKKMSLQDDIATILDSIKLTPEERTARELLIESMAIATDVGAVEANEYVGLGCTTGEGTELKGLRRSHQSGVFTEADDLRLNRALKEGKDSLGQEFFEEATEEGIVVIYPQRGGAQTRVVYARNNEDGNDNRSKFLIRRNEIRQLHAPPPEPE